MRGPARGPIAQYFEEDHQRLDRLLAQAIERPHAIAAEPFALFRRGLLRHIGLEEKVLLPRARRVLGVAVPGSEQLRADHSRLVALLVPTPTPEIVAQIRAILATHNRLEEEPDGVYEMCERLLSREADEVVALLRAAPEVPVRPHFDGRVPKMLER